MNASNATSYLSKSNLKKLNKAGVFVVGAQAVPGKDGSWANGEVALVLSVNGAGYVRDWSAVYRAVEAGTVAALFA